ncbi:uncharacterized protein LOC106882210 [Octopus bimaculoides]|uniref:uncharacterized protein LOC106882210 n=1 Tax=Octopus bimaculoides TaxID=37653 RepID=UPI0022E081B3|nr:uncharacterized protein LOC106882210 [Octopus bimaculoides]
MSLVTQLLVVLLCVHSLYGTHHYNLTIGLLLEEPVQKENKVAERAAHFAYMLNACDLQSVTVETFILKQHDPINIIFQISEFLKKNMTAIISKISCSTFHLLNSQPKACHLLHFTIIPPFCGETSLSSNNCNVFSLREKGEYLQTAIIDLLLALNSKKLTVLVDESSSETASDPLFQKISDNYIRIRPYKADGGNLSDIFLSETKTFEHSYYLLLMKPSLVKHVFNVVSLTV